MKTFNTPNGLHAIEDSGEQDYLIGPDWVSVSDSEAAALREQAQPSVKTTIVTMRQCQLALLAAGLLDQVDSIIATQPRSVQITWATATTAERDNPLITNLSVALGLTPLQVDELFEQAALL